MRETSADNTDMEDEPLWAYEGFADVYDIFMDNVPYDRWADRIEKLIRQYGIREDNPEKNIVADLGCGTGQMTERLADRGFDMVGIDLSEEMLAIAMAREEEKPRGILYLNQDMTEFELYGCAGAVVSVCDSVNYLFTRSQMLQMMKKVNLSLLPGGLFIFDFNTLHKYRDVIGDTTIAENRKDCSFIWQNEYKDILEEDDAGEDRKEEEEEADSSISRGGYALHFLSHINIFDVTFFVRSPKDHGLFHRFREVHFQRGWLYSEIEELLSEAGLEIITAVDDDTDKAPGPDAERIVIAARKPV